MTDHTGSTQKDAIRSFPLVMSQGEHRSDDLQSGLGILLDVGLVFQQVDRLVPSPALFVLASLSDIDAVRHLRRVTTDRADPFALIEIGAAGEAAVIEACRAELKSLGHVELAAKVMQVSLLDDTLGYDVSAPTLTGQARLLEVKTTMQYHRDLFVFFLSRNEFEIGRHSRAWAMVACEAVGGSAQVIGWCRASAIAPYLPADRRGRWTEARIRLPRSVLLEGLPPAI
ncbi:DUF3883 domain-containing protein [Microbacterium sp. A8/3-1]|uniref:DUF3883 domain-containing protein n=1 Tax=Microbacterium sp. A8/3-1 TaxID=3160749 RepID=A0AAU7VS67_9MICO